MRFLLILVSLLIGCNNYNILSSTEDHHVLAGFEVEPFKGCDVYTITIFYLDDDGIEVKTYGGMKTKPQFKEVVPSKGVWVHCQGYKGVGGGLPLATSYTEVVSIQHIDVKGYYHKLNNLTEY